MQEHLDKIKDLVSKTPEHTKNISAVIYHTNSTAIKGYQEADKFIIAMKIACGDLFKASGNGLDELVKMNFSPVIFSLVGMFWLDYQKHVRGWDRHQTVVYIGELAKTQDKLKQAQIRQLVSKIK